MQLLALVREGGITRDVAVGGFAAVEHEHHAGIARVGLHVDALVVAGVDVQDRTVAHGSTVGKRGLVVDVHVGDDGRLVVGDSLALVIGEHRDLLGEAVDHDAAVVLVGINAQEHVGVLGLHLARHNHITGELTVHHAAGHLGQFLAVEIDVTVHTLARYGEGERREQVLLVIERHRGVAIETGVHITLLVDHLGLDLELHQRADVGLGAGIGHVGVVDPSDVETRHGIVDADGGVTQQQERQLVGVARIEAQLGLHVGLAQGGHGARRGVAEHGIQEEAVQHVVLGGIYHA